MSPMTAGTPITDSIVPHPLDLQFIVGSKPLASSAYAIVTTRVRHKT